VHARTEAQEKALKPGDPIHECADCPQMVVVPAGSFMMGSPETQRMIDKIDEHPQHTVTIAKPFAVSKFEVTFAEWNACWTQGGCPRSADSGFGGGQQPVINVSWDEAQEYVAWLSRITGKAYRLLTEARYEYAARAGTQTKYPWGDDIELNGQAMANCNGCGSQWDNKQTAPVGSFAANKFGLYDMVGNVFEWTEDCSHDSYQGAPTDGSAWRSGNCSDYVVRGAAWNYAPVGLRSAARYWNFFNYRSYNLGFRVGRPLTP
jgi:formylglycine-generating enzyme required for sulfatase activity